MLIVFWSRHLRVNVEEAHNTEMEQDNQWRNLLINPFYIFQI